MVKRPASDVWTVGIVPERIENLTPQRLRALRNDIVWMPPAPAWCYRADPFGIARAGTLHVFVEAYDYRTKRADLQRLDFDLAQRRWSDAVTVLKRPFHLSYPHVFEHDGTVWMVPETHQAGEVALYRADDALTSFTRVAPLLSGVRAVDASLIRKDGLWWMLYSIIGADKRDRRELHVAHAQDLSGPWTPHAANPVLSQPYRARPAGTPFVDHGGLLIQPVQDSDRTYGGATRWLVFDRLTTTEASCRWRDGVFTGDLASVDHTEGLHTMSACGDFTLIDVKRVDRSRERLWLDLRRRLKRWAGYLRSSQSSVST